VTVKEVLGTILIGAIVLALILGLSWVVMGNDFFLYQYFAPKQAAVERQVFENTPSFNKGMVQELDNMRFDYIKEKDPNAKLALRDAIIHRASGYNLDDPIVSPELRAFIRDLNRQRELGQ